MSVTNKPDPKSPSSADGSVFYYNDGKEDIFDDDDLFDEENEDFDTPTSQGGAPAMSYLNAGGFGALKTFLGWGSKAELDAPDVEPTDEYERRGKRQQATWDNNEDSASDVSTPASSKIFAPGFDSGEFEKRSPFWVQGWRPYRYVLKDGKLAFFKVSNPDKPVGTLDFKLVEFEVHCCWSMSEDVKEQIPRSCDVCDTEAPEDFHTIFLKPKEFPSKIFAFRGDSEEIKSLADKLAEVTKKSWPEWLPKEESMEVSKLNFWRYPYVMEDDFLQQVESGDILLFRGKDRRATFTRTVAGFAHFDHVALLLRTAGKKVVILEATGSEGVNLVPWGTFKEWGWHRCYEKLAYRKVYFKRSTEQLNRLEEFIRSQLGARYQLNLHKILKRKTSREFDQEGRDVTASQQEDVDEALGEFYRTFFCSELVAACLKRCGVLAGARASAQYWPGSFSQYNPNTLPMQQNAYIGAEQFIVYADDDL